MPSRKHHQQNGAAIGAFVGLLGNLAHQDVRLRNRPGSQFDSGELCLSALTGYVCARATGAWPDVLEPATHPRHRGTCHSWAAFALVSGSAAWALGADLPPMVKLTVGAGIAGYLLHLLDDAGTPFGLPLL